MDITRLAAAVGRRWYLFIPLVLLTGLAAHETSARVAPEYQADGSVLFYAPSSTSAVSNPFASPVQAATALSVIASGSSTRSAIAEQGLEPGYEVEVIEARPGTASSIVSILVRAGDPGTAAATRDSVIVRVRDELEARQVAAAVAPVDRTQLTVLVSSDNVSTITTAPLRAQIVVAALGLALSFLLVVLVDDLLLLVRARRRRRALWSSESTVLSADPDEALRRRADLFAGAADPQDRAAAVPAGAAEPGRAGRKR